MPPSTCSLLEKEGTGLTAEETAAATEYGLAQIRKRRDYLLGLTDKFSTRSDKILVKPASS